jgi:hypothetical protein
MYVVIGPTRGAWDLATSSPTSFEHVFYPVPMGTNKRYGDPAFRDKVEYVPVEPKVRHVWVVETRRGPRYPGVVLTWRRERDSMSTSGWVALVAMAVGDGLSVHWVASELLEPVKEL